MPNIVEYTSQIDTIHPSETGAEAWNRAGMRIEEGYRAAGQAIGSGIRDVGNTTKEIAEQVQRQETLHDVSQGTAAGSALLADKTQQWNDIAAHTDPNDMGTARQKFLDGLTQDTAKFSAGFRTPEGQLWAAGHIATLTNHFNEKTTADVSTAAGQSLRVNLAQTGDNLAAAVHNDPSSLDTALATIPASVDALVANAHGLSAEDAISARTTLTQELQRRIAHLGVASMMDRSVAAGTSMLSGKYASLLRPEDVQELENYGKSVTRANNQDAMIARSNQEYAERKASEAQANKVLSSMSVLGPDGQPTGAVAVPNGAFASVLRDPTIKPAEKQSLFSFMHGVANQETVARNDPATAADLMGRMGDLEHPTTPAEVADAVKGQKLTPEFGMSLFNKASNENLAAMRAIATNPVVKAEFDRAAAQITGPTQTLTGNNQAVRDKIDQFRMDTLRIIQDAAANHQDTKPFLDPKSPQYLFAADRVEQYRPTKDEIAKQLVAPKVTTPGTPAVPTVRPDLGETIRKALTFPAKPKEDGGYD